MQSQKSPLQTKTSNLIFESILSEIASKANLYLDLDQAVNDASSIEYQKFGGSTSFEQLVSQNYCGCNGGNCVC